MMSSHARSEEAGSISIWLALASLVMIVLVGLTVDLGGQVHAQQRAYDLAAQAARVGGQQLQATAAIEGTRAAIDPSAAQAAALSYLKDVGLNGTVTVTAPATITVTVTTSYRTTFLPLIGITHLNVTATASAQVIRSLGGIQK